MSMAMTIMRAAAPPRIMSKPRSRPAATTTPKHEPGFGPQETVVAVFQEDHERGQEQQARGGKLKEPFALRRRRHPGLLWHDRTGESAGQGAFFLRIRRSALSVPAIGSSLRISKAVLNAARKPSRW